MVQQQREPPQQEQYVPSRPVQTANATSHSDPTSVPASATANSGTTLPPVSIHNKHCLNRTEISPKC